MKAFKIWDKVNKTMSEPQTIAELITAPTFKHESLSKEEIDKRFIFRPSVNSIDTENHNRDVDIHGEGPFNGDIILDYTLVELYKRTSVLGHSRPIAPDTKNIEYHALDIGDDFYPFHDSGWSVSVFEIIGNKYENPDYDFSTIDLDFYLNRYVKNQQAKGDES